MIAAGLAALESARSAPGGPDGAASRPRRRGPVSTAAPAGEPIWRLISVPGQHAFVEAADALAAGLHVMIFSDNVPVDRRSPSSGSVSSTGPARHGPRLRHRHRRRRRPRLRQRGRTRVRWGSWERPAPVPSRSAACSTTPASASATPSGPGAATSPRAVGGASTLQALDALDDDPATEVIVIVSKPPADPVAEKVRRRRPPAAPRS